MRFSLTPRRILSYWFSVSKSAIFWFWVSQYFVIEVSIDLAINHLQLEWDSLVDVNITTQLVFGIEISLVNRPLSSLFCHIYWSSKFKWLTSTINPSLPGGVLGLASSSVRTYTTEIDWRGRTWLNMIKIRERLSNEVCMSSLKSAKDNSIR